MPDNTPAVPETVRQYGNEAYAATLPEADTVRDILEAQTGKRYFISAGHRNWRDGKPLSYVVAPLFPESE